MSKPTLTHSLITPEHLSRKAIVYVRQSSLEQVEKNTGSQAFQRSQIDLARDYGWPADRIDVIDDDLGKSGSTLDRRTGWQRLMEGIASNAVGAVFAANVSRLGRQMRPIEELRVLASYHGTLLCLDNHFSDPGDPNDTVLTQITASIAQYENKKRAQHMSNARMAKARQGAVVSTLPVGWIKGPDGKFDYDPAVKDSIYEIIACFWRERSIRKVVKAMGHAGIKIPSRQGTCLEFVEPTLDNVRRTLIHPAYAGTYIYGKTASLAGPVQASGQSARVKVPEHRWLRFPNHHPAYMTADEQEEIKRILKDNHFVRRGRPGRGPALTQGLLRCPKCEKFLSVNYHRGKSYSYGCGWKSNPCTRFVSYEFDSYVLIEVFKVLKTPPLEMLKAALEESRAKQISHQNWIQSERERLGHEERRARERADLTRGSLQRVHLDALQKLEKVLEEKADFEDKIAREKLAPDFDKAASELEELCGLAADVPAIWHHPLVTHQERKGILRCLINRVVVSATKERIAATIYWKSGQTTSILLWRDKGRYNLVRELLQQGLTVFEIQEHLAAGKTSNGQVVNITIGRLYMILRKLGLRPIRFSATYIGLRQKALTMNRDGQSLEAIAEQFNAQDFKSDSGKPWTYEMVHNLLRAQGEKPLRLEELHRQAIAEARSRGLNYREMAVEFNAKGIRRRDKQPWTARDIRKRWADLNKLQRKRTNTRTAITTPPKAA